MIVSRLTALFTDTTRNWYLGIRDTNTKKSWAWWKNAVRNKFGTDNWKWRMQQEFEKDRFSLDNKKVHKWFNTQRERLRAFPPELSEYFICEKILKQCPGNLEHAVKSRFKGEANTMTFEDMVIIIEEVIDRVMRHQYSGANSRPQWRPSNPGNTPENLSRRSLRSIPTARTKPKRLATFANNLATSPESVPKGETESKMLE